MWNAEEWERGACGLSLSGSFLQAFSAAGVRGHGPRGGCGRRGYGCAGQACAQALAGPTAVSWPGCAPVAAPLVISGLPRAAREDSGRCGALLRRQALVCALVSGAERVVLCAPEQYLEECFGVRNQVLG